MAQMAQMAEMAQMAQMASEGEYSYSEKKTSTGSIKYRKVRKVTVVEEEEIVVEAAETQQMAALEMAKKTLRGPIVFVFDVIVTSIESSSGQFASAAKLGIICTFSKSSMEMAADQINVSEYKANSSLTFKMEAEEMRKLVKEGGLFFAVTYSKNIVGGAQAYFSLSQIDAIERGMTDLVHSGTIMMERGGEVTGKLKFLCRLVCKCAQEEGESDCQRLTDKSINPKDIMFVLGESQKCASARGPCANALEEEEGDERLRLDLERYRSLGGGNKPYRMLTENASGIPACYELKKMAIEYEQKIDSIIQSTGKVPPPVPQCPDPHEVTAFGMFPDLPEPPSKPYFVYFPAYQEPEERPDFCDPKPIPVPIPDCDGEVRPDLKPIRFCPVCLTNMTWMPKFATCPKCGIKPMPVVEERHKEKKLSADQVLLEYLGKPPPTLDDLCLDPCVKAMKPISNAAEEESPPPPTLDDLCLDPCEKAMKAISNAAEDEECPPCRCTCNNGKICVHCRIRNLCAEFFKGDKIMPPKCTRPAPKVSEDNCVSPKDSRPHLAKVFSELRDLYDIKDTKRMSELDENCERTAAKAKTAAMKPKKIEGQAKVQPAGKTVYIPSNNKGTISARQKKNVDKTSLVPRNHGWAWSKSLEAKKLGWRPGAIRKPIKKLMKFFLEPQPKNASAHCKETETLEREKELAFPVLNVCKKDGAIYVTLRPLTPLGIRENPITFRIVKSDLAVALREIKRKLKDKGYRKCTCHQTLMMCTCRNACEKRVLQRALDRECRRHCIEPAADHLVLTDTSESDMEFDFDVTPPAGTEPKTPPPIRPKTANHSTQTSKKDLEPQPPKYPKKIPHYCKPCERLRQSAKKAKKDRGLSRGGRGGGVTSRTGDGIGPRPSPGKDGVTSRTGDGIGPRPSPGKDGVTSRTGDGIGPRPSPGRDRVTSRTGDGIGPRPSPGKDGKGGGKSEPMPVRLPNRFLKPAQDAAKAAKQAEKDATAKKKKGIDMMKYLQEKGTLVRPWNPNEGKDKRPRPNASAKGPDGLTVFQRRRKELLATPPPPLCKIPRRGKGIDPRNEHHRIDIVC